MCVGVPCSPLACTRSSPYRRARPTLRRHTRSLGRGRPGVSGCSAANDSYGKHTEHHLHPALSTSHLTSLTPLPANTVVHGFTPSASPCPTPRMLEVQLDADQATPQATCVKICRRIDLTSSLKQSRFLQYSGTHPLQQCSSNLQKA